MNKKKIKIVYIVDGGAKIGLGHVYQSITFAKILMDSAEISFLTKSGETVINKIENAGFIANKLSDDEDILNFIQKDNPNVVIIDKIDTSAELAKNIKQNKKIKLAIFTNLTNANRYADVAVTADIGSHFNNIRYFNTNTNTLYFYGPKYWILREEFHYHNSLSKANLKSINSILVTFGGSDPSNFTTLVANELLSSDLDVKISIILGASFSHYNCLKQVLEKHTKKNIAIYKDVNNVAELMFLADLVITSPGLSAFEALYVRTPILLFPQDQIQKETYQGFMKVLNRENINCLQDDIAKMDFTYPDSEDIINMQIGQGAQEIISAILGNE